MNDGQHAALERLLAIAESDTGQGRRVANFLLAWWNAVICGGFDLTDLWNVDQAAGQDMVRIFAMLAEEDTYPDRERYGDRFEALVIAWRPELAVAAD